VAVLSQGFAGPNGGIDPPGLDPPAIDPPRLVLVPFCFWLPRADGAARQFFPPDSLVPPDSPVRPDPAALRSAITAQLADLGWSAAEPLRWAITAVDPLRGLQLEGVGVIQIQECQERR
jgi:hypothetical protein